MTDNDLDTVPWYRQFWPWFLIALPASAVVAGLTTLGLAIHDRDGLVVDDYYKEGLAINRVLDRDHEAKQLGVYAEGQFDKHTDRLVLRIGARKPLPVEAIRLRLMHPTRANMDVNVPLHYDPSARRYTAQVHDLAKGDWYVQLEPTRGNWRLLGRLQIPGSGHLELGYPPPSHAG
ncbi:MAG TPA: FixH family protein [Gammaproteobacteria bacterium]|nr:FixH family protein [Gammaproteobacteria bacterium]